MKNKAFSMMELLAVMAVLAILLAIIIPSVSGARHHFNILKTKAQFQRYSLALENYKAEYGTYPNLGESPIGINTTPTLFVELLSAHAIDGGEPTNNTAMALNPNGIVFCAFGDDEIGESGEIIDAFGNSSLELLLDQDGDGFLDGINGVRATVGWRSDNITSWQ